MQIKVTEKCDRCQRVSELEIDSKDVDQFEQADTRRKAAFEAVGKFLGEQPREDMPDLIVWFKGQVWTKGRICEAHCTKTVLNQIEQGVFRPIDPTKRKPRTKKVDGENGNGQEAKAKKGSKGKKADASPAA